LKRRRGAKETDRNNEETGVAMKRRERSKEETERGKEKTTSLWREVPANGDG
jgi:hypothetical protein